MSDMQGPLGWTSPRRQDQSVRLSRLNRIGHPRRVWIESAWEGRPPVVLRQHQVNYAASVGTSTRRSDSAAKSLHHFEAVARRRLRALSVRRFIRAVLDSRENSFARIKDSANETRIFVGPRMNFEPLRFGAKVFERFLKCREIS